MPVTDLLAPLRAHGGHRRTPGLDDATLARFAATHVELREAIEAAAAEYARIQDEFAELLDLDEDAQIAAVQAVGGLAILTRTELLLIIIGLLFVLEASSVAIQVSYFKLTHGKRVFKMAPFHHHLEMGGWTGKKWSEKQLFCLYSLVTLVFAVVSFVGIYGRYTF